MKVETENCECGHNAPLIYIIYDKEGLGTCMPCYTSYINDLLTKQKKTTKRYKERLKKCNAEYNKLEVLCNTIMHREVINP